MLQLLTWAGVWEFFKVFPGLVLFPFSIYFLWKKIGNNILAQYTYSIDAHTAPRVSDVTLINKKDKALTIFSVSVVIENKSFLQLESFSPPVVLKANDVLALKIGEISGAEINGVEWTLPPPEANGANYKIVLNTSDGIVDCKTNETSSAESYAEKKQFKIAHAKRWVLNGVVYGTDQKYALVKYLDDGETSTLFVNKYGVVRRNDNSKKIVPKENLESCEKLQEYLDTFHSDPHWSGYRALPL